MSGFTALQIDRSGKRFVTIQGSAGETRNLLFVDDGLAIQHNSHGSSNERDVVALPFIRPQSTMPTGFSMGLPSLSSMTSSPTASRISCNPIRCASSAVVWGRK